MGVASERNTSVWHATADVRSFPSLSGDARADVVVVGGGITGLTTALLLKDAGASVILLEEGRMASGSSGSNTAKVTALHGLTYARLLRTVDRDKAQQYADANAAAVERVSSPGPGAPSALGSSSTAGRPRTTCRSTPCRTSAGCRADGAPRSPAASRSG